MDPGVIFGCPKFWIETIPVSHFKPVLGACTLTDTHITVWATVCQHASELVAASWQLCG